MGDFLGKAWGTWVVQAIPAGLFLGISCANENESVLRRYMQFGVFLPIIKLVILGVAAVKNLVHPESTAFYIGCALSATLDYFALSKHFVDVNAVVGVCVAALLKGALLLHAMWVIYPTNKRRAAFWASGLALGWLSALGLFHEPATAAAIYRLPELKGDAPAPVFHLVGVLVALLAQGCFSIASIPSTDTFEKGIISVSTPLLGLLIMNKSRMGLFGELLVVFYIWCVWFQYGRDLKSNGFKMPTAVRNCLGMFTGKGAPGGGNKSPGGGKRSRSRTPGRKNK